MGLGGLSNAPCRDLLPREWRMLRQVASLVGESSREVFFLHDPFFEFSESDRETFAAAWARFAWEKKKIVIVTKLSERPESWIENDFIARIQLERPRQATIGFGGGDTAGTNTSAFDLKKLRSSFQSSAGNIESTGLTDVPRFYFLKSYLRSPRYVIAALFLFSMLIGGGVMTYHLVTDDHDIIAVTMNTQNISGGSNVGSGQTISGTPPGKNSGTISGDVNLSQTNASLFNSAPDELQQSWNTAIEHPISLLISTTDSFHNAGDDTDGSKANGSGDDAFQKFYEILAR